MVWQSTLVALVVAVIRLKAQGAIAPWIDLRWSRYLRESGSAA